MPQKSAPPQIDLGVLVGLAFQTFVDELHLALARAGFDDIGRSDGYVFRLLAKTELTIGEVSDALEITKQGAAQIVGDMESRGYLLRRVDPRDARACLVRLSPRGERALAAARRFHHHYERQLRSRRGTRAVTVLRELLTAMAGNTSDGKIPPLLRRL